MNKTQKQAKVKLNAVTKYWFVSVLLVSFQSERLIYNFWVFYKFFMASVERRNLVPSVLYLPTPRGEKM